MNSSARLQLLGLLIVLLIVSLFLQKIFVNRSNQSMPKSILPVVISTPFPSPTVFQSERQNPSPTEFQQQLNIPSPTKTSNQPQDILSLQYPNSTITGKGESSLFLESRDDHTAITSWYKDKIKSMNMNVKTFVTTNTNGNVLNKLVGANNLTEVNVEITKQSDQSVVKMNITLSMKK